MKLLKMKSLIVIPAAAFMAIPNLCHLLFCVVIIFTITKPSISFAFDKTKVAILGIEARQIEQGIAETILDSIAVEISNLGNYEIITKADIKAMLDLEAQKMMLECEDNISCLSEIGNALGVDLMITGSLGRIGDVFVLALSLVNPKVAKVENRVAERVKGDLSLLLDKLGGIIAKLFIVIPDLGVKPSEIPTKILEEKVEEVPPEVYPKIPEEKVEEVPPEVYPKISEEKVEEVPPKTPVISEKKYMKFGSMDIFTISGFYWVRGKWIKDIDLDKTKKPDNSRFFQHRFKIRSELRPTESSNLKLHLIGFEDDFWGKDAGDVLTQSTADETKRNWRAERVWGEVRFAYGLIRIGRMPSNWGMGIVANSGDEFDDDFGDNHFGDTADRILFATRPLGKDSPLLVALAFGQVVEDENILDRTDGRDDEEDDVLDGVFVIFYDTSEFKSGIYGVYRSQESTDTKILILDYYGKKQFGRFFIEGEMAWFLGESKYFNEPGGMEPKDIGQGGGVIRAGNNLGKIMASIEIGYATGDGNLNNDDKITNFSLNPDHNVGLIMFEEVMARATYEVVEEIRDNTGTLPTAAKFFATEGKVTNAIYVMPLLKIRPTKSIETTVGFLWARANKDFINPFHTQTSKSGGTNVGLRGAEASARNLGFEVDVGLEYSLVRSFRLGLQGGYFWPGNVFDKGDGAGNKVESADKVSKIVARFTLEF